MKTNMNFFAILMLGLTQMAVARRVQMVNISPEEAQRFITQQSLDLHYATKLGEHPLGYARNIQDPSQAKFYYNGRVIEHPEDYVEEEYEASQFHGQDGLGRVMFGYSDHNQARLEARNANQEVRGTYQYVDPNGEDVIVQYWSDGLGFHQVDNRPIVQLQPVTETPEVRAARIAHMQAWEEAANMARANPLTSYDPYKSVSSNGVDEDDDEETAALSNQQQSLVRYPSLPYTDHISPQSTPVGAEADESVIVEALRSVKKRQNEDTEVIDDEADEPRYEPKGFFYSFDYPVQLISETAAKRSGGVTVHSATKRTPDSGSDPEESQVVQRPASPVDDRVSLKAVLTGEPLVDAVHDAQVSPKQKLAARV